MSNNKHASLGASLYVPSTRADLQDVASGVKLGGLSSIIFCTEDAVRADEVDAALANLRLSLPLIARNQRRMHFVRVRNPHVLGQVLQMPGVRNVDGFVLPKITADNIRTYLDQLSVHDQQYLLMPTLETTEVFDTAQMVRLRDVLSEPAVRERILSLRIGGNDLMNLMGIRRVPGRTIYETAVGHTISMLANVFKPHGFNLSGAVCEVINDTETLVRETVQDMAHGLFGKTIIHPSHQSVVEGVYKVDDADYTEAESILAPDAPAVFKMNGRMCEPATHRNWAEGVIARANLYGRMAVAVC